MKRNLLAERLSDIAMAAIGRRETLRHQLHFLKVAVKEKDAQDMMRWAALVKESVDDIARLEMQCRDLRRKLEAKERRKAA